MSNLKLGILTLAVLVVIIGVGFAIDFGITGSMVSWYCSEVPEITNLEQVGNNIAVNWKDTSAFLGQVKYEVQVYAQDGFGDYDFSNTYRQDMSKKPYTAFQSVNTGTYLVRVRATNKPSCSTTYSAYAEEEITIVP